ncbi:unnamed protein product [Thelazia callipaeda]|uniref:Secreted protein n=1 Tax=Thelazia callipaeda TaxID=103827 RepID=A0A0N5CNL2_THECL|nr:unnamed protein product [Thelazia callipaeda]
MGLAMLIVAISKTIFFSYSAVTTFYAFQSLVSAFDLQSKNSWLECFLQDYCEIFF